MTMIVSICIVAYNEEQYVNSLFECICNQTYALDSIEVVLIDSQSTDNTLTLFQSFEKDHKEFYGVQVLNNPKQRQSAGWNIAIDYYRGDVIIRLDAHATIAKDFVERNVACLMSGEKISGGQRPSVIEFNTPWKETLLVVENSLFGSSIAPFKRDTGKHYVKSMFHPAYVREVFESVGYFNEYLGRTEDNEMSYRIRKKGYNLCYDPSIVSHQHIRNNLRKLLKQKYSNGYWVGLTSGVHIGCLSIYHFAPFVFLLGIMVTSALWIMDYAQLAIIMWSAYFIAATIMSVFAALADTRNSRFLLLPFLFLLLHTAYGLGTFVGLIYMPLWRLKIKRSL